MIKVGIIIYIRKAHIWKRILELCSARTATLLRVSLIECCYLKLP